MPLAGEVGPSPGFSRLRGVALLVSRLGERPVSAGARRAMLGHSWWLGLWWGERRNVDAMREYQGVGAVEDSIACGVDFIEWNCAGWGQGEGYFWGRGITFLVGAGSGGAESTALSCADRVRLGVLGSFEVASSRGSCDPDGCS